VYINTKNDYFIIKLNQGGVNLDNSWRRFSNKKVQMIIELPERLLTDLRFMALLKGMDEEEFLEKIITDKISDIKGKNN